MFEVLDQKISISGTSAGSATINIPRRAMRCLTLAAQYTVTDAGISAGENLAGCIDSVQLMGDDKVIFRADRDELPYLVNLLARQYGAQRFKGVDSRPYGLPAALMCDVMPTTATAINAWFRLNLPHDLRQYKKVELVFSWRAITDEFGAASAFSATIQVGIDYGAVKKSLSVMRYISASSTVHDIPMGDLPVMQAYLVGAGAGTVSDIKITGKDKLYDYKAPTGVFAEAEYCAQVGVASTDGAASHILTPELLVAAYPDRRMHVELSSAASLKAFFTCLEANSVLKKSEATIGEVERGTARTTILPYMGAAATEVTKMTEMALDNQQ